MNFWTQGLYQIEASSKMSTNLGEKVIRWSVELFNINNSGYQKIVIAQIVPVYISCLLLCINRKKSLFWLSIGHCDIHILLIILPAVTKMSLQVGL